MSDTNNEKLLKIIANFPFEGELVEIKKTGSGHINSTYLVTTSDSNVNYQYILQLINPAVFKKPDELMSNVMNVTGFLRNKIILDGGNPERETLTFLYTKDNSPYHRDDEGACWRAYNYIGSCTTYDKIDDPVKLMRSAKAFGVFQKRLADYPIDNLFETIPNFHNTPARYEALKEAIENNLSGRLDMVKEEVEFALSRECDASKLTDMIKSGDLPIRVTHNDTKINNVLFDLITNEAFCVIDLDTVMPGLSLYDFGDGIRSGAVTADEDEKDLDKFNFDIELYNAYVEGFLSEAAPALTQNEVDNLAFSAKLMTLECGVRFLTDFLNGDVYFGIAYPEHNLVRCRTQFKLVREIEKNLDEMNKTTAELYRRALLEE
ncbi:MAG: aminoglycoside phosphotransferase family protein [Clostridia bacterium]|nr:aminoglycoside phosphotransferase family protein [Clostridia bacterium]